MMSKSWKRKILTAILAMALIAQYTGVERIAMAKSNEEQVNVELAGTIDADDDSEDDSEEFFADADSDDVDDADSDDADSDDADSDDGEEEWVKPYLSKTSLKLTAGKSSELEVEGDFEDVQWKSGNTSVVTVDEDGALKAKKAGKATITATVFYYDNSEDDDDTEDDEEFADAEDDENNVDDGDENDDADDDADDDDDDDEELSTMKLTCTVTVTAAPVKISATNVTLKAGKSKTLKVTGATGKVTWKTSNKKVAKVSNGKVTAVKAGKAKITAKTGGKTLTCTVTVKKK